MQFKMNDSVFFIFVNACTVWGKPIATQLRYSRDQRDNSYGEHFPLKLKIYKLCLCIFIPIYAEYHDHTQEDKVYQPPENLSPA